MVGFRATFLTDRGDSVDTIFVTFLGKSSADILVGFGAFVNLRPTRMSALQKNLSARASFQGDRGATRRAA